MSKRFRHYSWPVSPYSAKTRTYLQYKGIPFDDVAPSALRLMGPIRKAVGRPIMPTIRRPDGSWMQDTSEIIDQFEREFPDRAIVPDTPRQRVAAYLLELHGDEWLPSVALHFRWNIPENNHFARTEFAKYGLPGMPRPVAKLVTKPFADKMSGYLPLVGVSDETIPGFEAYTKQILAHLDAHLADHLFLFGTRPSIADFALFGPLWAHLYRDPGSTRLFDETPKVVAWFDRLLRPSGEVGAFLPDDEIPETLDPIIAGIFADQIPFVRALEEAIHAYCEEHPDATRVPRALGSHAFTVAGREGTRKLITFSQWMAQRPVEAYQALDSEGKAAVDAWLERAGAALGLDWAIRHPFERRNFKMRLRR